MEISKLQAKDVLSMASFLQAEGYFEFDGIGIVEQIFETWPEFFDEYSPIASKRAY